MSKLIKTLNLKSLAFDGYDLEDNEYILRNTARGIILKENKIAFIKINNTLLPGGGVEDGETFEEALLRECKEEMNMSVSVKENIGHIINYKYSDKNSVRNKYFVECFVCEYAEEGNKNPEGEIIWLTISEGIKVLSDQYKKLEINLENSNTLFNLKTHIIFLKEYRSLLTFRQKSFDKWNYDKKIIAEKTDNDLEDFYFREREIWWCKVGVNIGYEQDGKGEDFLRPVVVIKKLNKFTFLGVPLSSVIKKDNNRLKINFVLKDKKEAFNDALLNQIRIFDIRRVKYQLGTVKESEFIRIKKSIQEILV